MFFIAHRGNTHGPNPSQENSPEYIQTALEDGYYVEVDVWYIKDSENSDYSVYLGHDKPQYKINWEFLSEKRLICHAKNEQALYELVKRGIHCFSHDVDNVVLTSNNWLWTYPGKPLTPCSIAVMPEMSPDWDISICMGVCSDYATFSKP